MNIPQKHIFFVEDDVVLLEITERFLSEAGFKVSIAKDGAEALEMLKTITPDIILLDILLPRIDGFEILKSVKGDPRTISIPVVVLQL